MGYFTRKSICEGLW